MIKTFQYTTKIVPPNHLAEELNYLGNLGWELVALREFATSTAGGYGPEQEVLELVFKKEHETTLPVALHIIERSAPSLWYRLYKHIFKK